MCEKRAQRGKHRTEVTEVTEGLEFCGRKFFSVQGGFRARKRLEFFQDLGVVSLNPKQATNWRVGSVSFFVCGPSLRPPADSKAPYPLSSVSRTEAARFTEAPSPSVTFATSVRCFPLWPLSRTEAAKFINAPSHFKKTSCLPGGSSRVSEA